LTTSIVRAPSVIDVDAVPVLRQQFRAALDVRAGRVIEVDMAAVTFIDSAGLGVLVSALKQARLRDGDLAITNVSARVMKIFEITGLDKVFALPASG
jgi:anti-sigma B factor antagonist